MRPRPLSVCGLAALAIVAAGCGEQTAEESAADLREQAGASAERTGGGKSASPANTNLKRKPVITVPKRGAPAELEVDDIVAGKGVVAKPGKELSVNYVGVAYSTGQEFDSNFGTGQPFQFQLGAGMVIPGWDQGLEGMKVGGRRQLTIPAELAYGPQGSPPAIGPNETLIFQIDLLSVR